MLKVILISAVILGILFYIKEHARDENICERCHGEGHLGGGICPDCEGTGHKHY